MSGGIPHTHRHGHRACRATARTRVRLGRHRVRAEEHKVVPPAQSEAFRDVCLAKGIKHKYFEFEGESHGFRKASSIITAYEAELTVFGEVLGFIPKL